MNISATATEAASIVQDSQVIGKDGFLQLLVTQLQNQDPLNPMSNEEFIGQLTQFSTLEQMQNLNDSVTQFAPSARLSYASSLIGQELEFETAAGDTAVGTADGFRLIEGEAVILVGAHEVPLSAIQAITPAPATTIATGQQEQ